MISPRNASGRFSIAAGISAIVCILCPPFIPVALALLLTFLALTRATRGIFWKVYFWVITVIGGLSHVVQVVTNPSYKHYIGVIAFALVAIALYGYSHKRQIGSRTIWRLAFPGFFALIFLAALLFPDDPVSGGHGSVSEDRRIMLLMALPLVIPAFIGFFNYAFLAKHIWGNPSMHLTKESS